MNIDKICHAAKQLLQLAEDLEMTTEELSAMTTIVNSEVSERYIRKLQDESSQNQHKGKAE